MILYRGAVFTSQSRVRAAYHRQRVVSKTRPGGPRLGKTPKFGRIFNIFTPATVDSDESRNSVDESRLAHRRTVEICLRID